MDPLDWLLDSEPALSLRTLLKTFGVLQQDWRQRENPMSHCRAVFVIASFFLAVDVRATTLVPPPLEIAASSTGDHHWTANGNALPADGTIVIPPGQTLAFKALDGRHGVGFAEGGLAKKLFRVMAGQFKDNPPQGKSGSWGTWPASPGSQPLALLQMSNEAKSGTVINFFCTQHGTPVRALKVRSAKEGNVLSATQGCAAGQAGSCELLAEYYEKGSGVLRGWNGRGRYGSAFAAVPAGHQPALTTLPCDRAIARYLAAAGELTDVPGRSPPRAPPYWKSQVLRRQAPGDEGDGGDPGRGHEAA